MSDWWPRFFARMAERGLRVIKDAPTTTQRVPLLVSLLGPSTQATNHDVTLREVASCDPKEVANRVAEEAHARLDGEASPEAVAELLALAERLPG